VIRKSSRVLLNSVTPAKAGAHLRIHLRVHRRMQLRVHLQIRMDTCLRRHDEVEARGRQLLISDRSRDVCVRGCQLVQWK
jgi:hypothetical protein